MGKIYFTKGNIAANPKLLSYYSFVLLFLHIKGMLSFLPDVGQWTLSREHGLPTSLKEFILCSTVLKKYFVKIFVRIFVVFLT